MPTPYAYRFGHHQTDGGQTLKELLGGKGANLAEMCRLGIPVPSGFTLTTEACTLFTEHGRDAVVAAVQAEVVAGVAFVEHEMGKTFGDAADPLLLSLRSGARASMPGMMDTILNLGLNDEAVQGLAARTGDPRFAWDSYRRFVQMYGDVVMGLKPLSKEDHDPFELIIEMLKAKKGVQLDTELDTDDLRELVTRFKALIRARLGREFPTDPWEQLWGAIIAVFESWNNDRARVYRELNDIPSAWGTAVNVQAMVFGNLGETSGTGVAFTRDAGTGEDLFNGEFLMNAQGEDVVAGIHFGDMQDLEFTIQEGKLWMLQTRTGKRTGAAMVRIAIEMLQQGRIDEKTALLRVAPDRLAELLHPIFDPVALRAATVIARGLPASPGAATGQIVFFADEAEAWAKDGKAVILVRQETSPEDLRGMSVAKGILTARGGMTSHAAVVARGMGKCCVSGAGAVHVDGKARTMTIGGTVYAEGAWVSLDGSTGEVYDGQVATKHADLSGDFGALMTLADRYRRLEVRTNADTPDEARVARAFGATGIGLCRTEHMFFEGERILAVRRMILADDTAGRRRALERLLPIQRADFLGLFREMSGLPVTIRLLDPPLHEFVPHDEPGQRAMANELRVPLATITQRVDELHEFNPMLGHRGCRLGITYPEITEMQTRAILEAGLDARALGADVKAEIMVPLVGTVRELDAQAQVIRRTAAQVFAERGETLPYLLGTMIETPRAALVAGSIAGSAEFFPFGTNDLTQMTLGFSRDDAGKFLPEYLAKGIYERDPFRSIDQKGVGVLVDMAVQSGRAARPGLEVGVCGEHGGDPTSVAFFHRIGLDYVSCSPYRVPIARLAAAQAALRG